jgi:two-component system nitrogen regulation response regulator GlnG
MVGANAAIEKVRGDVVRVADIDVPVLIRGESGTGKELLAHAIHNASHRKSRPFVALNMAAITTSTAASELFGHVRGAFTGAARDHEGLFMRANGGTLFLDEVGETPAELQAMLLRVLETGEIQPVGATRTRKTNVRLVAATDADLESETQKGRFKLPLLHRLSGYELRLPPLRDRVDDIARLFVHFFRMELEAVGEAQRLQPTDGREVIPAGLMARMCRYEWPGNVRQLRNVVRQIVISSRGSEDLVVDASVERLLSGMQAPQPEVNGPNHSKSSKKKPAEITDDELLEALRRHDFQPGPVAREFGMSRTTLYARIEKSPCIRKASDLSQEEIGAALVASAGDLTVASRMLEVSKRGLRLRMTELDG